MAETVELGPLEVTLLTERRTSCLLCAGRCDPGRWTCSNCHRRLMAEACQGAIEEALKPPEVN